MKGSQILFWLCCSSLVQAASVSLYVNICSVAHITSLLVSLMKNTKLTCFVEDDGWGERNNLEGIVSMSDRMIVDSISKSKTDSWTSLLVLTRDLEAEQLRPFLFPIKSQTLIWQFD